MLFLTIAHITQPTHLCSWLSYGGNPGLSNEVLSSLINSAAPVLHPAQGRSSELLASWAASHQPPHHPCSSISLLAMSPGPPSHQRSAGDLLQAWGPPCHHRTAVIHPQPVPILHPAHVRWGPREAAEVGPARAVLQRFGTGRTALSTISLGTAS